MDWQNVQQFALKVYLPALFRQMKDGFEIDTPFRKKLVYGHPSSTRYDGWLHSREFQWKFVISKEKDMHQKRRRSQQRYNAYFDENIHRFKYCIFISRKQACKRFKSTFFMSPILQSMQLCYMYTKYFNMVFMEHVDLFRIKYVQILRHPVYYMCTTNSKSFVLCYIIIYKIKIVMLFRYCAFWRTYQLKVKKFQNEFMKSSFLQNMNQIL